MNVRMITGAALAVLSLAGAGCAAPSGPEAAEAGAEQKEEAIEVAAQSYASFADWRAAFERAGFTSVSTKRVVDSRGPGSEADFTPDEWTPDWAAKVSSHEAGSLWIHGEKPG